MSIKELTHNFIEKTLDFIFPIRRVVSQEVPMDVAEVLDALKLLLESTRIKLADDTAGLLQVFGTYLNDLEELLVKDINATYKGDPAAKNLTEIILAYPGFYATAAYRIAHFLLQQDVRLLPRMITEIAHSETGIDIHPGAQIGQSLCIDHGTGVVIGETVIIGNNVKIYQGVTLGALSIPNREIKGRRHPIIEDNVILYAQAIILGGNTTIGHNSIIGGNVWITESVRPFSKIYYYDQINNRQLTYINPRNGYH